MDLINKDELLIKDIKETEEEFQNNPEKYRFYLLKDGENQIEYELSNQYPLQSYQFGYEKTDKQGFIVKQYMMTVMSAMHSGNFYKFTMKELENINKPIL